MHSRCPCACPHTQTHTFPKWDALAGSEFCRGRNHTTTISREEECQVLSDWVQCMPGEHDGFSWETPSCSPGHSTESPESPPLPSGSWISCYSHCQHVVGALEIPSVLSRNHEINSIFIIILRHVSRLSLSWVHSVDLQKLHDMWWPHHS